MEITKSVLCDATPSWNGYNYQGKVGLYVCLENILVEARKGVDTPSFELFLSSHHIEYEWIEDFAIKHNDNYLSLHQVKHKGENKFTDHVEAIATILFRKNSVLSDTDIFKYFVFKSRKKGDTALAKESIKNELTAHKLIDDSGKLDTNWEVNVSAVDSNYYDGLIKCFSDFELLAQRAFSSSVTYFHTVDEVDLPSTDICGINGIPSSLVRDLINRKSLSCKNIFLSFDDQATYKLALSDDELNSHLELQIGELLELLHIGEIFSEVDIKLYKTALCGLVDQILIKRHQHVRDKIDADIPYLQRTKPSIYFKEIVSELKSHYRVQNDCYWNLICRENFEMAYKEKLDDLYSLVSNSHIDDELYRQYHSNLESLRIDVIEQYLPNKYVGFLKQIYPHQTQKQLHDHQFYNAISEPIKIKKVFLNFMQKVMKHTGQLTLSCSKNVFVYQPSCIDFNDSDELQRDIGIDRTRKGLAENNEGQSLIHNNVDYIVVSSTGAMDVIPAGIDKITDVESYQSTALSMKASDKFTERKEIYFVDSRKALGEING